MVTVFFTIFPSKPSLGEYGSIITFFSINAFITLSIQFHIRVPHIIVRSKLESLLRNRLSSFSENLFCHAGGKIDSDVSD